MNWKEIVAWIGGIGTVITVLVMMLWGVPYYITVKVSEAVSAQDLGTDSKIVAMDLVAADNTRTGSENAEDIAENKQAVRDAFQILMEN